ncbi:MAG: hypothetical protein COW24_00730 [Candidatus Kerfeldbacteria bacterium CG15_BIG_FIL_POST_REV_8_21_14_020_45_12]|uniref:N-acetyltransferase domain-containing protein n=1 Tax=Candidatus Kerfeldbacteria bacterium CG15_BIG_FIL_POST_REV_8_21_14_020_45_12 TaxID=2014247 RepID=A0A2M7H548_9BACT|nr:MAG: hypothetical protein COW24_00730 [Candidatus Kerfeldbacteria bacterium CG15_BIG_FIL_POST_REV_8_21_14_020_45_12]PJA93143.1 MAG: hypothetical protein CO132_04550 [Candidatus Kerfeldbacteria bacterium CG_4_9_14_3_um_filter_45_8]
MPCLVEPAVEYKESVLASFREYADNGIKDKYENQALAAIDFQQFVLQLQRHANTIPERPGVIPESFYWLIDDSGEHVGDISVRHFLSERLVREGGHVSYLVRPTARNNGYGTTMLKLVREKAKLLGLARLLVCCDENNTPSVRIIEQCGGKLADKIVVDENDASVLRYWLSV